MSRVWPQDQQEMGWPGAPNDDAWPADRGWPSGAGEQNEADGSRPAGAARPADSGAWPAVDSWPDEQQGHGGAAGYGTDPATSPLEVAQLEAVRRKLLSAVPGPKTAPREAARQVLNSFLPRAFRRPATAQEAERYLSLFDKAAQRGDSYDESLKLAL